MVSKILTVEDTVIVPDYVALFNRVLAEIGPYYNEQTVQEAASKYTTTYVEDNLSDHSKVRFIGHFTEQSLDGLLIEQFDTLDGNRTTLNWVLVGKKGLGIGTHLINECISRAKTEGKDNVTLAVSQKNSSARMLYEKLGFISGGMYNNTHGVPMEIMGYIFT